MGDKIEHYTHHDHREHIIQAVGYERWENTGQAEKFGDISPPTCYTDLFSVFIDLHYLSPNGITYQDIAAFCNTTQNKLSIHEVSLIRKMASWAASEVNKAWRENH